MHRRGVRRQLTLKNHSSIILGLNLNHYRPRKPNLLRQLPQQHLNEGGLQVIRSWIPLGYHIP
jgi:hypothetical protein